jgi:hypothetical protein
MTGTTPAHLASRFTRLAFPLAFAILVTLTAGIATAWSASLRGPALIDTLRQGGHIVYFRHFGAGSDTADQHRVTLGIPAGDVLASPFCRAWRSADLASGRYRILEWLRLPPSQTDTDAGTKHLGFGCGERGR